MFTNLDIDSACNMLFEQPAPLLTETVALGDALTRVLSETVFAKIPVPPFDRSPNDGYAFRGGDTIGATPESPAVLEVVGEIPAGTLPDFGILPGQAAKILTGAPIPSGADSTIKYELTEFTEGEVRIFKPVLPDTDIVRAGSAVAQGAQLALQGSVVTAPIISLLADQGFSGIEVYKKPVVTIISTGSELNEPGEKLRPAAIYSSNVFTLSAYLTPAGVITRSGVIVRDDPRAIAERVGLALIDSDMVITTGGASVGDYDCAVAAAKHLGADVLFWKAALRPGGAILVSVKDGKVILGLSGHPSAAVIGLLRIGMPYIKKLCGMADCFFPEISVALSEPLNKASSEPRLLRGRLEIVDSQAFFVERRNRDGEASSFAAVCDLLGEIPAGSPPLPAGTIIKAYCIV